jgi:hypothetical protein
VKAPNATPPKPPGNNWFMMGSLLVMAVVLVLVGLQMRKPATHAKPAAAAAATEQPEQTANTPAPDPNASGLRIE